MGTMKRSSGFSRLAWNSVGTFFVVIGVIGMFVPLLPTTEFLILASYCYCRGSRRMQRWLLRNRVLGSYITNYTQRRGMALRAKLVTLTALWAMLGYLIATMPVLIVRVALLLIAAGVTWHLVIIRTIPVKAVRPRRDHTLY